MTARLADVPNLRMRGSLARWIVALDEAIRFARLDGRQELSRFEFARLWFGGADWTEESLRQALHRLHEGFASWAGLKLQTFPAVVLGADLCALVDQEILHARRLCIERALRQSDNAAKLAKLAGERERIARDLAGLAEARASLVARRNAIEEKIASLDEGLSGLGEEITELLTPEQIARECSEMARKDDKSRAISERFLSRRYGVSRRRVKKLVELAKVKRLPRCGRQPIESVRPEALVKEALRVHSEGGSVRDVARVLGCAFSSALMFLRRQNAKSPSKENPI